MTAFLGNTISKLCNAVSVPMATTPDAVTERLQGIQDTASLLYNRMMENMGYGQEKLKHIIEKETGEEENPAVAKEEEEQRQRPTAAKE